MFGALVLLAVFRPRVRRWNRSTWLGVGLLGLALAGMNSLIYLAIDTIPLGVAVTLEFMGPLLVALVQTRRWLDAAWAVLAFAGVLLLGLDSSGAIPLVGIGFALGAGLFWAGYILANARLGKTDGSMGGLAMAMVVAAIVVVPFGARDATDAVMADPRLLGVFAIVAVLTSALPYSLEMVALRRLPTRVFGVLSSLGPAVAAMAGLVVLQQALGVREVDGPRARDRGQRGRHDRRSAPACPARRRPRPLCEKSHRQPWERCTPSKGYVLPIEQAR